MQMSQTMSIVRYLAKVLDHGTLNPRTIELEARADMLVSCKALNLTVKINDNESRCICASILVGAP